MSVWLAALSSNQYRQISYKIAPHLKRTLIIASRARDIAAGDLSGGPVGPEGIVAASLILDRIRHLHMTSLSVDRRVRELSQLETLAQELVALDHIQPIREKLVAAVGKAKNTGNKRYVPLSA